MSYDFSTQMEIDGEWHICQDAGNMTWNVNVMYYRALEESGIELRSLSDWSGKPAKEILPFVEEIISGMEAMPNYYKSLEPSNGWGTYDGALAWMKTIRKAILLSPDNAVVRFD